MSPNAITFGTDGWRDVIADNFTFDNVCRATQAVADYVLASDKSNPALVIGHDTRFLSRQFAAAAAEVLAERGIKVFFAADFSPTPAISFAVINRGAQGGIVLTASHNPPEYGGFKFKASYGGSASTEIMAEIEANYLQNLQNGKEPRRLAFDEALKTGAVELFNPEAEYFGKLKSLLDVSVFAGNRLNIMVDPLYGAGQGHLKRLLGELGCRAEEIHSRILPTFGGLNPEPIELNLRELSKAVLNGGFNIGLALDGDADRIGAIDELGNFVDSHQIFSLVLKHLVEERGWTGKVVKTVSTTQMVNRLAKKYDLPLIETPIGFKYICDHILAEDVLIGGEESGGISIKGHIPERDGLLMGCLIIEVMLAKGEKLSELLAELSAEVGPASYIRIDKEISQEQKGRMIAWLKSHNIDQLDGEQIIGKNMLDGFKFFFEGDNWLLLRPSGTEPVVRIYAEANSREEAESLIMAGINLLRQAGAGG